MTSRPTEIKLDEYGQNLLDGRAKIGHRCIDATSSAGCVTVEDRETAASDAISDILTALYGPAGTYGPSDEEGSSQLTPNPFALNEARRLVESALRSWENDAEDYTEEEV